MCSGNAAIGVGDDWTKTLLAIAIFSIDLFSRPSSEFCQTFSLGLVRILARSNEVDR